MTRPLLNSSLRARLFGFKQVVMLCLVFIFLNNLSAYAQKGGGKGVKDIIIRACTEEIGNGLYNVNFSYENPNKKDVIISEDDSFVTSSKGNNKSKGVHQFNKGRVDKAFSKQFSKGESVEWTVINPNGKVHTVVASASSSHCLEEESGIIFPVFGQGLGKYTDLIGAKLGALAAGNAGNIPSDIIYQINGEQKVLIEIVPNEGNTQMLIDRLQNYYGVVSSDFLIDPALIISENLSTVDGYFPINRLLELNAETSLINFARPLYRPFLNSGIVTSQGDSIQKTDHVRDAYRMVVDGEIVPVDGRGIKIGVISDSYNKQPFTGKSKAQIDIENGDLPGALNPNCLDPSSPNCNSLEVEILKENAMDGTSDEGRAMLQILHDVVPGAELAFYSGIASPRDFELGIKALQLAECDLIVDDITFITEPFYGFGRIPQTIKNHTSQLGKAYFTSAGNFADDGYSAVFQSSGSTPVTNFLNGVEVAHVFGTNPDGTQDVLQKISVVPGVYMIVLQWDEALASQENRLGAISDLDIYIVDDNGKLIVGNNRINDEGDPTEIIVFQATGTGNANIMITNANGAPPPGLSIRYIAFRADGLQFEEYAGASTISGHAMTLEANAIAAINFSNSENPEAAFYSSSGGALTNGQNTEVAFAAPDGVNTNVGSIGQDSGIDEETIFPNFFGTSAAAPHAAGSVALLLSALPSMYPDGLPLATPLRTNMMADQAISLFKQNATPAGDPVRAGAGLLNAAKVFDQIAAKTAQITKLIIQGGEEVNPSAEPFTVTIVGKFFPETPTVIFDGEELEILSSSETEIEARVGVFTGNPPLVVHTQCLTPGCVDGGDSPPKFFFEDGKIAFNIVADKIAVIYGQSVVMSYTIDGLPEGENLETLGLPNIAFHTPALFPFPDVNNYVIFPEFDTTLSQEQKDLFQVNFINGTLQVSKKDLTIQPMNAEYTYGGAILNDLMYLYDAEGIENNSDFLELIQTYHQADFYSENTLILINKLRAVVNEQEILNMLNKGSWMTSDNTIQNKLRAVVNGQNFIDLDPVHFEDYLNADSDPITNKLRAVVNKLRAVVNALDLLRGDIPMDLVIENKLRAVVNETGLGDENDKNDYSKIFAVLDAEDGATDTDPGGVGQLYAMNLLTGLGVTNTEEEKHFIFPGAFLSPLAANFNITYDAGRVGILPATLTVSTGDLLINQGEEIDVTQIPIQIEGYVYEETFELVFPEGLQLYFVNSNGKIYESGDTGIFDIMIMKPEDYKLTYTSIGQLYINPYGDHLRKVRTYLDCIEVNSDTSNDLGYIAHFSYENPNSETIYVFHGDDNNLSGPARLDGLTPIVFLPGEGTFDVLFDGEKLIWNLTTFESTHKSSVSSEATSASGKCDAKGVLDYNLYPNPVNDILNIERNIAESGTIEIFNVYGILQTSINFRKNDAAIISIDLTGYPEGIYIVRIATRKNLYSFSILKQ